MCYESINWIKLVQDISSCQFVRAVLLYVNCFQNCKLKLLIVSIISNRLPFHFSKSLCLYVFSAHELTREFESGLRSGEGWEHVYEAINLDKDWLLEIKWFAVKPIDQVLSVMTEICWVPRATLRHANCVSLSVLFIVICEVVVTLLSNQHRILMHRALCMCVLSNALQLVKAALPFMTVFNIWHSNSKSRRNKLKVHAAVLRVVEPCNILAVCGCFWGTCSLQLQPKGHTPPWGPQRVFENKAVII
jgi:hypothetical protein